MYKVDVIVISRDNVDELMQTLTSLVDDRDKINKVIIVDDSQINYRNQIREKFKEKYKIKYLFQKSNSIYNAFNVGLSHIEKDFIFINSGDWLVGSVLKNVEAPGILPTISVMDGKLYNILVFKKFMRFFNHQSIIFDSRFKDKFDENYKISSDFDFFIRYCKLFGEPKKIRFSEGMVCFALGGVSTTKKLQRDIEYLRIYKHHGLWLQFICFLNMMIIKSIVMRYV